MSEPMSDAFIQGEIRLVERFGDSCQYSEHQILARLREILRLRAEVALLKVLGAKADEVVCAALKADRKQKAELAALKAAGRKLDSKIEECAPFERAIYCSALIHGVEYRGPTFKEEREALRALCAETGGVG